MKTIIFITIPLFIFFEICGNDKSKKFEGLYVDTLNPQRISFVLKYDSNIKDYYGVIMDRVTKQTYPILIDYISNDSLIGNSYNIKGENKKITGIFTGNFLLKITMYSTNIKKDSIAYFLKKVSNKPKYNEKYTNNKNYLDKNLIGKWTKLDIDNNLLEDSYIIYNPNGLYENSMINISSEVRKLIDERKMKYKWTSQGNILYTYIESTFPLSFDSRRSVLYKIEKDTLFLFYNQNIPSKLIKRHDK